MAEVLFFILGALFCLSLLAAVVALLPAVSGSAAAFEGSEMPSGAPESAPRRSARPTRSAPRRSDTRALPPPGRNGGTSSRDRDAYRVAVALERAEAVFAQISGLKEPAAAKIAGQTLRRLRSNDAPPRDRLAFALTRLELLSLRPEPMARKVALQALSSIG